MTAKELINVDPELMGARPFSWDTGAHSIAN